MLVVREEGPACFQSPHAGENQGGYRVPCTQDESERESCFLPPIYPTAAAAVCSFAAPITSYAIQGPCDRNLRREMGMSLLLTFGPLQQRRWQQKVEKNNKNQPQKNPPLAGCEKSPSCLRASHTGPSKPINSP